MPIFCSLKGQKPGFGFKTVVVSVLLLGFLGQNSLQSFSKPSSIKKTTKIKTVVAKNTDASQQMAAKRMADPLLSQLDQLAVQLQSVKTANDAKKIESTALTLRKNLLEAYLNDEHPENAPEEDLFLDHLDAIDNLLKMVKDIQSGQMPILTADSSQPESSLSELHPGADQAPAHAESTSTESSSTSQGYNVDYNQIFPEQQNPSSPSAQSNSVQNGSKPWVSTQSLQKMRSLLRFVQAARGPLAKAFGAPTNTAATGLPGRNFIPSGLPNTTPLNGANGSLPNAASPSSAVANPAGWPNSTTKLPANTQASQTGTVNQQQVGTPSGGPNQPSPSTQSAGAANNAGSQSPQTQTSASTPPPPPDECRLENPDFRLKPDAQLINENASAFLNKSGRKQREVLRKLRKYDRRRVRQLQEHCKRKAEALKKQQNPNAGNNSGAQGLSPICQQAEAIRKAKIGPNGFVLTRQEMDILNKCDDEKKQQAMNASSGCIAPNQLIDCVDTKIILDNKPNGPFSPAERDKLQRCPQLSKGKI